MISAKLSQEKKCKIMLKIKKKNRKISSTCKFCGIYNWIQRVELQQICVKLWCEVPGGSGNCKTAEMPAADGTPCGDNKVIVDVLFGHSKWFIIDT